MVISPGPGNTILAAAGGKFGVGGSARFWAGFETGNVFLCLLYGFGLGQVFRHFPVLSEVMKWASIVYLVYLAYGFFKSGSLSDAKDVRPLSFIDGFISVSLNPKIHSMIFVMFSQFLKPDRPIAGQVILITSAFLIVCIVSHLIWLYGGQVLFKRAKTERAVKLQGYLFGSCMVAVAVAQAFV
jgi:threonine/homoserine/homoserine lactone efflux protein